MSAHTACLLHIHTQQRAQAEPHPHCFLRRYALVLFPAGWFCGTVPSVSTFTGLQVLQPGSSEWQQLAIPSSIKALVLVNLQSYGGGRNIWGESESKTRSLRPPSVSDGLIEVRGCSYSGRVWLFKVDIERLHLEACKQGS